MTLTRKIKYKTHKKTRRQNGGTMKALRGVFNGGAPPSNPPPSLGNPLPIPVVAAGADLSFFNTQIPNPLEVVRGPPPPPIINTLVGQQIQAVIQGIPHDPANDPISNYLNDLLQYPESSNLENYVLIPGFLPGIYLTRLLSSLNDVLREKKRKEMGSRVGLGGDFDLFSIVQDPSQAIVADRMSATKLLSLMILSSRLSPKYRLRTNPESLLFNQLNNLFDNGNGANFAAGQIADIVEDFIKTNATVTISYLTNLINGNTVYNIYKTYYTDEQRAISQGLIKTRLSSWLKTPVLETPISYLFNKYTNAEKTRLNSDAAICQTIADFSEIIGKPTTPKTLLPKSVFNVDDNDDIDFDKLNAFLSKLGPAAAVKRAKTPVPP